MGVVVGDVDLGGDEDVVAEREALHDVQVAALGELDARAHPDLRVRLVDQPQATEVVVLAYADGALVAAAPAEANGSEAVAGAGGDLPVSVLDPVRELHGQI